MAQSAIRRSRKPLAKVSRRVTLEPESYCEGSNTLVINFFLKGVKGKWKRDEKGRYADQSLIRQLEDTGRIKRNEVFRARTANLDQTFFGA